MVLWQTSWHVIATVDGPDGKPIHAELTLRGTTLMLGPENPALGKCTAKSLGASPASLFLYVENVDKKEIPIKMMPEGWLSNLTFSGGIS